MREVKYDVAIVGELNPDLILYGLPQELPAERELLASGLTLTLGSSSAILAHNLALLGTSVTFTSCIGEDVFGEICCRRLREAGVDLSHLTYAPVGVSTGLTVILPMSATRRILTYPGAMFELHRAQLDLEHLATARHFHLSSLFLHRKLLADIPRLFAELRGLGLSTSLDTNDDPEGTWGAALQDVLRNTDILFCTEEEVVKMAHFEDLEKAAETMAAKVPTLVVKKGACGASAYTEGKRIDSAGLRVEVTDSIGAGDSFDAGFLHQWMKGASVQVCLNYANVTGALSVTRDGGTEAFRDKEHRERFLGERWRFENL